MAGIFPNGGVSPEQALPSNLPAIETVGTNCRTLYHNNRCNVRVDAQAVNSIIAELGTLVNCAGLDYDCSRFDNVCEAVKTISVDALYDCLPRTFPGIANACAIQQLVITEDSQGCRRIGVYSEESAIIATAYNRSVWGINYPRTFKPESPSNPATFYNMPDLYNDQLNGTVNESKLTNNHLTTMEFTLACETRITLRLSQTVVFAPNANGGNGTTGNIAIRVDGDFIPAIGLSTVSSFVAITNFVADYQGEMTLTLMAGTHRIDTYACAQAPGTVPTQFVVVGDPTDTGTILTVTRAVTG